MTRLRWHLIVAFIGIPLGLLFTMAIDRTPPYERERAFIMAGPPEDCGLPLDTATSNIVPGHCVVTIYYVKYTRDMEKECKPVPGGHVTRVITKNGISRTMPKLPPTYGAGTGQNFSSVLRRAWIYPTWGGNWDEPGPSEYQSEACYECNVIGSIVNLVHKIDPVCVNDAKISYEVSAK